MTPARTGPSKGTYTTRQVAALLQIHPVTVGKHIARGLIPEPMNYGTGARHRWAAAAFDAWLAAGATPPSPALAGRTRRRRATPTLRRLGLIPHTKTGAKEE